MANSKANPVGQSSNAPAVSEFITRWEASGAAERANYQLFLSELCDVLGVPRPEPAKADPSLNSYVFEHPVLFDDGLGHTTTKFIDLYRRGCFILEAKQGSEREAREDETGLRLPKRARRGTAVRGTQGWDEAMLAARGQAELYAKALPASEGWPPFLVVVDVGHSIELYADFSRSGKTYVAYPDALTHRIALKGLQNDEIRERLRLVWTDPLSLDPSRRSAKVTREVAAKLAELARSLERSGHSPERVAHFLMRCIFTMFAEDAELLPKASFTRLLEGRRGKLDTFTDMLSSLWSAMDRGEFSPILERKLLRFNGQLFATSEALAVTEAQLGLLIEAAKSNWKSVEPAIFGTLLERALDPIERHKLGAHYTPRAYVERLVLPAVIEPLREEWEATQAAAVMLARTNKLEEAREEVQEFLKRLCKVTVLDPACGSGNFLYVTFEHMKRIEGEARDTLRAFGQRQEVFEGIGLTVDPHQLLGIEVNPRAAAIAELVLWIGYLQWHFRTFEGRMPPEPIIKAFHNIECRDAVLAYDGTEPVTDENGQLVTRWDGRTMKRHPVTGEEVPDENARTQVYRYINPRKADWPKADYVVGNPPFIGNKRMRFTLGEGYVEALRKAWPEVPDTADYVMYWWERAGELTRLEQLRRFGLITTNSLRQVFNRQVLQRHLNANPPLSIAFAIPDHPWVDSVDGADVRIAMSVCAKVVDSGRLDVVASERAGGEGENEVLLISREGEIHANLTVGPKVSGASPLQANAGLCFQGMNLVGKGFRFEPEEVEQLGYSLGDLPPQIKLYGNAKDMMQGRFSRYVIDLYGLTEEEARNQFPSLYQRLFDRVKPERDHNNRESRRRNWWIFGEPVGKLRHAWSGLDRIIVTPETAKHRVFMFANLPFCPDHKLYAVCTADAVVMGVFSSRIHVAWALATGGRLGVGNDPVYNNTRCFLPFPFPLTSGSTEARIRELGEELDAHRKRQQARHPTLTLTAMYNVLDKLRSGETLSDKEKVIHEQGLVSVLKQIHDNLDAAVFDAYGWPASLSDEEVLERLVALNAERVAEEEQGSVRWIRPEFQKPERAPTATQITLGIEEPEEESDIAVKPKAKAAWPKSLAEQAHAVRAALSTHRGPITSEQLARSFHRGRVDRVEELLDTLVSLGQARELSHGRYISALTESKRAEAS